MAMTADSLRGSLRFEIDLRSGLIQRPIRQQLMKGDRKANTIIVALMDGKEAADITGVTVSGSFISPHGGAEILLEGSAENGNEAHVTLLDECYAEEGHFEIDIKLTVGETARTILSITGDVLSKGSGAVIDIGNVIPSIEDIVNQYDEMKRVTQETEDAVDEANAAAEEANTAASSVRAAAAKIDNMTVSAVSGDDADVQISEQNGAKHIAFTLPKGDKGDAAPIPYIGENGNWFVGDTDTGTKAQGPAGANGTGSGTVTGVMIGDQTYQPNEQGVVELPEQGGTGVPDGGTAGQILVKHSNANGDAIWKTPTAQDVGALPSDGTAADSSKLGGVAASNYALKTDISVLDAYPVGSIYMSVIDTDPAILFGGTWEKIKGRFLLGAGSNEANTDTTYGSLAAGTVNRSLGEMGGEAKVKLTVNEMPAHKHEFREINSSGISSGYRFETSSGNYSMASTYMSNTGGSQAHNNMPPYLAVNMWKRIADEEVS